MSNMKCCFVVCWFGKLPDYFSIWAKTCAYNKNFDFLLLTDAEIGFKLPLNVQLIKFTRYDFWNRINKRIVKCPSIKKPYRICDFRPMYGAIFSEELLKYDFWGYCDIDVVFGDIMSFLNEQSFEKDAIFNGGHFSLIRNCEKMNELYKRQGALFNYKKVACRDAIYAFDETTGIQRIARRNNMNVQYGIPYIETESKYLQLRSRMSIQNPDYQAFYWENGHLFRAKAEEKELYYQEVAYMHLQKRKLKIIDDSVEKTNSFWITPKGFEKKLYLGKPKYEDILHFNPNDGEQQRVIEEKEYKRNKFISILKRGPFQVYVRIRQQFAGINANDGIKEEQGWIRY